MIRFLGEDLEDGHAVIGLVLDPETFARLAHGQSVDLDLQVLAPDVITQKVRLNISYERNLHELVNLGFKQGDES